MNLTTLRVTCSALLFTGLSAIVSAQTTDLVTPTGNILLPNYKSVPLGPNAGLEGSAYVARVGDPSATWLNPAGLSRAEVAELSGAAGLVQVVTVSPRTLPDKGGSIDQVPSLVAFMAANVFHGLTLGLSGQTTSSWAQETNSELILDHGTGRERFAYSADSKYEQIVSSISVGYLSGKWRLGGGFGFARTSLKRNEVISDRLTSAANLRSVLVEQRASGSTIQLRPIFGVQRDLSAHLRAGALVRTPVLTVQKSGSYTADGLAVSGSSSQGISLFDAEARFANKVPFEIHGGVAYVVPRLEVEVDVQAYTPVSTYSMLSSDESIITYSFSGAGSAPAIGTRPFGGFDSQSRGMANVSAGGHVLLTSSGVWRLHFGSGTDLSPVGPDDELFTKVNLYNWTVGLSGRKAGFQFTAGLDYRSGSSNDVIVRELENGDLIRSGVRVRTVGLIYALNYQFR